ncbi:hypothetical protein [Myroides odoratimimus]|uniref:Uncharacterized protein n=1 Tax=Myroides odoratimimus CIP 101113 TaxID=883154 RepID=A0AAV3F0N6_9FLAO|nr:hypothetical protein [Myroides odoratimimus]EHO07925.1 hypothetical protein HMPREF9715_02791 [Myroides odoratimimus CIP 101113]
MANDLPKLPEDFIPKFEEDDHQKERIRKLNEVKDKRKLKANNYIPNLRNQYIEISELMKNDLQPRQYLSVFDYIKYKIKTSSTIGII